MSQYTDLSKVAQVSALVTRIEGELEDCAKQARLFNAREVSLIDTYERSKNSLCELLVVHIRIHINCYAHGGR